MTIYQFNMIKKACFVKPWRSGGFTLVELLVTLSIIGLLLVVGIPAFKKFSQNQVLLASAKEAKNAILETQALSLAPKISAGSVSGSLKSYRIVFDSLAGDNQSFGIYEIYVDKIGAETNRSLIKNFQLSQSIKLVNIQSFIMSGTPPQEVYQADYNKKVGIDFNIAQKGLIGFINEDAMSSINDIDFIKLNFRDESLNRSYWVKIWSETGLVEIQ